MEAALSCTFSLSKLTDHKDSGRVTPHHLIEMLSPKATYFLTYLGGNCHSISISLQMYDPV